jgi:murein L,D-transpeptidase YcbB/YkuD
MRLCQGNKAKKGVRMSAVTSKVLRLIVALMLVLSLPALAGPVDEAIRAKLELAVSKQPLRIAEAAIPQGVAEFYAQRQWQPVWDDTRLQSLLAALADTYTDGLDPDDYFVAALKRFPRVSELQADPQTAAQRDMLATHAYLLALVHLYHGKTDPQQLDPHWNFDARQFDPENGLTLAREAAEQGEIAAFFDRARPKAPQYNLLRTALARLREMAQNGGWVTLPAGPTLKPGNSDARVALLRQRLQQADLLPKGDVAQPEIYDPALVDAVKLFQTEAYLTADGAIGPQTLAALNVPLQQRIDQVRVNLERGRWLLHELEAGNAVIVDIAGYRVSYMRDGEVIWRSRVQIGKEYRATPVFQSTITYITLSPGWVIPPTILRQDTLPAIRRDPNYLAKNNLRVINAAGKEIPATSVDWAKPGNITLRQDPGPNGALGEMAIRFDNPYAVYLHDTPHQELFNNSQRATSSGCIRVENVHELAELLFDDQVKWNRDAMQSVINERKTRNVTLAKPVRILLAYWTVDVGDDGHVSFKPDVYNRDARVLAALNKAP